jgi:hypothetical protein
LNEDQLWCDLQLVLRGLFGKGINVVAYACDGTETERGVQHRLVAESAFNFDYTIPHPNGLDPDIVIPIATFDGHPILIVQDAKHALKTLRNNLNSGARLLVTGNHVITYEQARALGFDLKGPLYRRDFEKLDRQDDAAAARVFSSPALHFLIKTYPDRLGVIVYLFVFGELIDAWLNRHISHSERLLMALRAHFYLEMWVRYLERSGHPVHRHCISREALDICNILIRSLVGLIIVYRDHLGSKLLPLLFWKLTTEVNEHVFGRMRDFIKEYNMMEFLYMVPKLQQLVDSAIAQGPSEDTNLIASGYQTTFHNSTRASNLALLAIYPNDEEIRDVSRTAYMQSQNLWFILGVGQRILEPSLAAGFRLPTTISLGLLALSTPAAPSIDAVYGADDIVDEEDTFTDDGSDDEGAGRADLQRAVDAHRSISGLHDDRLLQLEAAGISLEVEEAVDV